MYTNFFDGLQNNLESKDLLTAGIRQEAEALSTANLRKELELILAGIDNLEKYAELLDILVGLKDYLTLRIINVLYDVIVDVEERVWGNIVPNPPFRPLYTRHKSKILRDYPSFAYNYEKDFIEWCKIYGYLDNPDIFSKLKYRNDIYRNYVITVGEIVGADTGAYKSND